MSRTALGAPAVIRNKNNHKIQALRTDDGWGFKVGEDSQRGRDLSSRAQNGQIGVATGQALPKQHGPPFWSNDNVTMRKRDGLASDRGPNWSNE